MADHGAGLHAKQQRSHGLRQVAEKARHRVAAEIARVLRWLVGSPEGGGQALEQWAPGVDGAHGPFGTGHRLGGQQAAGRRGLQPGGVTHVKVGDSEQLFQQKPGEGIRVALRLALGGRPMGQLATDLPIDGSLRGQQTGQVAEQIVEGATSSEWTGLAHTGMVGP